MGTSRPVIVNHGTLVQDRTVVDKSEEKGPTLSAPSVTRKVISPISGADTSKVAVKKDKEPTEEPLVVVDTNVSDEVPPVETENEAAPEESSEPTEAEAEPEPTEEPAAEEKNEVTDESEAETEVQGEPVTEEEPDTENAETPAGSDSGSVDALAEASEKKKLSAKEEEEQQKREAALQEMIDSKQYYVPIAHDSGKSGHGGIWVLFIIILLAVGAYAAIDSGALDVNVELPYHFFKQQA